MIRTDQQKFYSNHTHLRKIRSVRWIVSVLFLLLASSLVSYLRRHGFLAGDFVHYRFTVRKKSHGAIDWNEHCVGLVYFAPKSENWRQARKHGHLYKTVTARCRYIDGKTFKVT